jgi:hypothetical protein
MNKGRRLFTIMVLPVLKYVAPPWGLFAIWSVVTELRAGKHIGSVISTAVFMQIPIVIALIIPLILWLLVALFDNRN